MSVIDKCSPFTFLTPLNATHAWPGAHDPFNGLMSTTISGKVRPWNLCIVTAQQIVSL